jgi:hypothetical protein
MVHDDMDGVNLLEQLNFANLPNRSCSMYHGNEVILMRALDLVELVIQAKLTSSTPGLKGYQTDL